MSVDIAYERLRKANPVAEPSALRTNPTDVDVFLKATQQRSTQMDTSDIENASDRGRSQPKPGWRTAAVAFLAVVAFGSGLLVLARRDGDVSSRYEERVEIVKAQAQAYSDGDLDRWLSYFTADASMWSETFNKNHVAPGAAAGAAAKEEWTLAGSCVETEAGLLTCPMRRHDVFHGAGGLDVVAKISFAFDSANQISSFRYVLETQSLFVDYTSFERRFDRWLETAYPDVYAGFGNRIFRTMPNAADMPTALEYVDEFVTQSDVYPVGS